MEIKIKRFLLFFILFVLIVSCTKEIFYTKAFSFKENTWNLNVKPTFKVEIKDTTKMYDFVITLRTTTDYEFSNCWIYLNSKTPSKKKGREPFEIKITNPDGSWIGNKTGTIVENSLIFKQRKFPEIGTYYFTIEQAVVQENLNEVLDITLNMEEKTN